jgi:hypothetical protein
MSMVGYRLREGLVEHMDRGAFHKKIMGTEILNRKPSVPNLNGGGRSGEPLPPDRVTLPAATLLQHA